MSLVSLFASTGPSGFGARSTAEAVTAQLSLEGKTFLVTGCNSGLGLETLRILSLRGARVLATARTEEKAQAACAQVAASKGKGLALELADPASVRACVEAVKRDGSRLDGIICNAGIMALPEPKKAFGYELQFFTNHVGHFMLVTGLLDRLADEGRVVMLSSGAHMRAPKGGIEFDNLSGDIGYTPWKAYGQSKLANLLFAKELARRLRRLEEDGQRGAPGRHRHQPEPPHEPGAEDAARGRLTALFENTGRGRRHPVLRGHPPLTRLGLWPVLRRLQRGEAAGRRGGRSARSASVGQDGGDRRRAAVRP